MAGKGVVGKLSVKVVPDIGEQFKQKLRSELKKIAEQVDDIAITFDAEVNVDDASLERAKEKIERSSAEIKARLDVDTADIERVSREVSNSSAKMKVNLAVDKSDLRVVQKEIDSYSPKVKVQARLDDNAVANIENRLRRIDASVLASPNLSDKAAARLKKEVASIRADIDVAVEVSPGKLAEIKQRMNNLQADVQVDMSLNRASYAKTKADIERLAANVDVKPKLSSADLSSFRSRLQLAAKRIDASVHLSEEQKRKLKRELGRLDAKVEAKVDVDGKAARFQLARLARDRFVKFRAELDQTSAAKVATALSALSGFRGLKNVARDFKEFATHLDETALRMGVVASGALTLGAGLGSLGANALAVVAALVKLAPALYAIPSLMLATAAGVTTLKLAFSQIDAYLPGFKDQWNAVKTAVGDNFWASAAAPMQQIADTLIPALSEGLGYVASKQAQWVSAIASTVQQSSSLDNIRAILGKTGDATGILTSGVADVTSGLLSLSAAAANTLPDMARWFDECAAKFRAWAEKAASDGSIERALRNAWQVAKDLWSILDGLGGVFGALFSAAEAGGYTLGGLVAKIQAIEAALQSVQGQEILTNLFSGANGAITNFLANTSGLGPQLVTISDTIRRAMIIAGDVVGKVFNLLVTVFSSPEVTDGIISFFQGVSAGISHLQESAPQLGELLGSLGTLAGDLALNFGTVLGAAITNLGPSISALVEAVIPLADALSGMLTWVLENVPPEVIFGIAGAILAVVAAFQAMQIIMTVVEFIEAFSFVFTALLSPVGLVVVAIVAVIAIVVLLWNKCEWFRNGVKAIWDFIVAVWNTQSAAIIAFMQNMWTGITTIWNAIWTTITTVWNLIWGTVTSVISTAIANVKAIINGVWNFIQNIWAAIQAATRGDWDGVKTAIGNAISGAWDTVRTVVGNILSFFGGLGSRLFNSGKSLIQGFVNGIKSMISTVVNTAKNMVQKVRNFFPFSPAKEGPFSGRGYTSYSGVALMEGFAEGIEDGGSVAVEQTRRAVSEVASQFDVGVSTDLDKVDGLPDNGGVNDAGATVNIVNNYPNPAPDSKTRDDVAQAIRLAATI